MQQRAFLLGSGAFLAVGGVPRRVLAQPAATEVPPGFARLRVTEGELTVNGKTGKAYRIQQDDGTEGFAATKGERFQVALENATRAPISIHWHGLILPHGQDGVPYVTQRPLRPGERRLYDFSLVQAGTYWMHSHFGLQEQPMMTAPLILRDPKPGHPEEQDVVIMLNDFTTPAPSWPSSGARGSAAASREPCRAWTWRAAGRWRTIGWLA